MTGVIQNQDSFVGGILPMLGGSRMVGIRRSLRSIPNP